MPLQPRRSTHTSSLQSPGYDIVASIPVSSGHSRASFASCDVGIRGEKDKARVHQLAVGRLHASKSASAQRAANS